MTGSIIDAQNITLQFAVQLMPEKEWKAEKQILFNLNPILIVFDIKTCFATSCSFNVKSQF